MSTIRYRILPHSERPSFSLPELFGDLAVADICDALGRNAALPSAIKPLGAARLLGTAYTVNLPAGENLLLYYAVDNALPGDVLAVAQVAGIQAAKHNWELIPMCHPLPLTGIDITFHLSDQPCMVEIRAAVTCTGVTGVEMEALTAVSVAALTVYDMCKAVQKDMEITNIRLLEKSGGKSGDYKRED